MSTDSHFEIQAALLCDDVRQELTGKRLLIGVYSGVVILPELPCPLGLMVFLVIRAHQTGECQLNFRVLVDGEQVGGMMGVLNYVEETTTQIEIPVTANEISKPAPLHVDMQQGDGAWERILTAAVDVVEPMSQGEPE